MSFFINKQFFISDAGTAIQDALILVRGRQIGIASEAKSSNMKNRNIFLELHRGLKTEHGLDNVNISGVGPKMVDKKFLCHLI